MILVFHFIHEICSPGSFIRLSVLPTKEWIWQISTLQTFATTHPHPLSPWQRIKAALDGYFKCWYCWDFVGLTQGLYQDTFFVSIISGLPMRWTSSREGRLWNDNILVWTLMDSSNSYQKQRSTPDQSKSITKLIFQSWVEFSVNIPGKIKRRRWLITYHHVVTVWLKRKEYKAESKSEEIMLGKFLLSQLIRKAWHGKIRSNK